MRYLKRVLAGVIVPLLVFVGCSSDEGSTNQADTTPPAKLTAVQTSATTTTVTFSWTNPSDSDYASMIIQRSGSTSATVPKSQTSYTVEGLTAGTDYSFSFISVDTTGNQSAAYVVSVTTKATEQEETDTTVASPSNLNITVSANQEIPGYFDVTASWTASTTASVTYKVSISDVSYETPISIDEETVSATTYSSLLSPSKYKISVTAVNESNVESNSVSKIITISESGATEIVDVVTIAAPTNLLLTGSVVNSGASVLAEWAASTTESVVEYKVSVTMTGVEVYSTTVTTTTATISELNLNTEYEIAVTAYDSEGNYSESVTKTITVESSVDETELTGITLAIATEGVTGTGTYSDSCLLHIGDAIKITMTVDPSTADASTITWHYDDTVFTYDSEAGTFTAKKSATTYIYCFSTNYVSSNTLYFTVGAKATSVSLGSDFTLELEGTTSKTLSPSYYDAEGEIISSPVVKTSSWLSSDTSVATVSESGVVTAVSKGTATITYTADGVPAESVVTVVDKIILLESVSFTTGAKTVAVGAEYTLVPVLEPENANSDVVYKAYTSTYTFGATNTESDVVTITGTTVKAKKEGVAYIYAQWQYGSTTYISGSYVTFTVKPAVTSFSLDATEIELGFTETYAIDVALEPTDAIASAITYESDNTAVSVSEDGVVSTTSIGPDTVTATITVKVDELTAQTVKVTFCIPVTSIELNKSVIVLGKNSSATNLTATVLPENATNKTVTWETSNADVITVADGTVTVKGDGFATITAKAGGKAAVASVLVLNTSDTFTYDASSLKTLTSEDSSDYEGYTTDTAGKVAYKYTTNKSADVDNIGKFDIIGYDSTNNKWQSTTYVNAGWGWKLNDTQVSLSETGSATSGNLRIDVVPVLVYDKGIPFVIFVQALTNIGTEDLTNQKFGSFTDIQVAGNDNAPVTLTDYGANLMDEVTNMVFALYSKSGEGVTPVSSHWIGKYASHSYNHVYDDGITDGYTSGQDSAMAYSWQNIDLAAGETKIFSVRLTFIVDEGGTLAPIVY
ncbi:MAG: fibronectin type III domain-containing protein [Treponema sp.]|nr:fibronectin type III domain-containing protein [Treponema sp.]